MLTMKDIVREGHPQLRKTAQLLTTPLSKEDQELAEQMMEFLKNSQDEQLAEQYDLRPGVGLAAPQLGLDKQMIAVHIPNVKQHPEHPDQLEEYISLSEVLINPKIIRESLQKVCLPDGEGCLSVDREVPGYVPRAARIKVRYTDIDGKEHERQFKDYEAIVLQHEIDHLNGILFYDHIHESAPWTVPDGVTVLQ